MFFSAASIYHMHVKNMRTKPRSWSTISSFREKKTRNFITQEKARIIGLEWESP
jgi:hypothetical protein